MGSGIDQHKPEQYLGVCAGSRVVEHTYQGVADVCLSPWCSQQSQGIPLISVSSVTSGGSAGKAGKRQMSSALEEDRGEKLEKSGEALEMGNAWKSCPLASSVIFVLNH